MKKLKIVLMGLLASVLMFNMVGCTLKDNAKPQIQASSQLVAGFETLGEMQSILYENLFGKADLNDNSEYVTQGSSCAKLDVIGAQNQEMPAITFFLRNERINLQDISRLESFTMDIYNDTARDVTIYAKLSTITDAKVTKALPEQKIVLLANKKNPIKINIDRNKASIQLDLGYALSLRIRFDHIKEIPNATDIVVYADNLVANLASSAVAPIVKTFAENEINNFNSFIDTYFVIPDAIGSDKSYPIIDFNTNAAYAKSEGKSLKLTVNPSGISGDYPGFGLAKSLLQNVNFGKLTATSKVCIDVFNNSDEARIIYLNMFDVKDKRAAGAEMVEPRVWTTITIGYGVPANMPTMFGFSVLNLAAITRINVLYDSLAEGNSYQLYFDNFRMEI